jgi:hypothetical protein
LNKSLPKEAYRILKKSGFEYKTERIDELDHGADHKWEILDIVKNVFWKSAGLMMKRCSINVLASARALAKLGALITHKG